MEPEWRGETAAAASAGCFGTLLLSSIKEAFKPRQRCGMRFSTIFSLQQTEGKSDRSLRFSPEQNGQKVSIWNHQLIRYAGYETEQGVIGDPASLELTKACEALGWKGEGTPFDVLPLVFQIDGRPPVWYELPREIVKEVRIEHPEIEGFKSLGLKWYAVPIIADMKLEVGGIHYNAAPFNGWYMGTEIGARNLADADRYNALEKWQPLWGLIRSGILRCGKTRRLLN